MASKLFQNFNLAERALTHCVRSLATIEPIITTQSSANPRFLVSLRSFASGGSPDNQTPSPPPPPQQKQETEAEAEQPNGDDSHPTTNPVLDALRASIQEQIIQLRSQSTMMEQTMPDPLPWWQRALVDRFVETTGQEYRSGGLIWRTEVDEDVPLEAQLRRISFWSGEQIAEYDKEQAALEPENASKLPMPAGKWLIMWVSYQAAQKTLITREEDGQIVAKLTDLRPALWTFAAGPLPGSGDNGSGSGPPGKLEVPFWLLKFG
ncbi:hypothetical protein Ndes2437A_g02373 [Nannochloris sp. 'desiccata']